MVLHESKVSVFMCLSVVMAGGGAAGVDLNRKFVSEAELDERRKKRQEEWEKVRKPDDPEGKNTFIQWFKVHQWRVRDHPCILYVYVLCSPEAPEEEYDPRSLFERLQEQKDKKQEEYEEQFKFSGSCSPVSLMSWGPLPWEKVKEIQNQAESMNEI